MSNDKMMEFNRIFSENLKKYLNEFNLSYRDLGAKVGVSGQTVGNWANGIKTPRMDKVDKMCTVFSCRRSDLLEEHTEGEKNAYYFDSETAEIAQEIAENKNLSLLFDSAKDATPEDLETVHSMLLALKRKERNDD